MLQCPVVSMLDTISLLFSQEFLRAVGMPEKVEEKNDPMKNIIRLLFKAWKVSAKPST